jgi:predicted RNA-binding protein
MGDANAYFHENDEVPLIMESVVIVEPDCEGSWHIAGTSGDRKIVKGRIRRMTLVKKWILFEPEQEPRFMNRHRRRYLLIAEKGATEESDGSISTSSRRR